MADYNIQLEDGNGRLYPITNTDCIILRNVDPIGRDIGELVIGDDVNGLTFTEFLNKIGVV